jgi:hypothetical protein
MDRLWSTLATRASAEVQTLRRHFVQFSLVWSGEITIISYLATITRARTHQSYTHLYRSRPRWDGAAPGLLPISLTFIQACDASYDCGCLPTLVHFLT